MKPNRLFLLVSLFWILILVACATQDQKARQETCKAWLKNLRMANSGAETVWKLQNPKIFGPSCSCNILENELQKEIYQVSTICWVSGENTQGEKVKVEQTINATLVQGAQGAWVMHDIDVAPAKELSIWSQHGAWALFSFIGPWILVLIFFPIFNFVASHLPVESTSGCYHLFFGILVLFWVGYYSWLCYGSVWAVLLGVIIYALVYWLFLFRIVNRVL